MSTPPPTTLPNPGGIRLGGQLAGSVTATDVPLYQLYGDQPHQDEWSINVEPLDRRSRERGWVIDPHMHPRFTQIMVVLEGAGAATLEGETSSFEAPCLLIVPRYAIHGYRYVVDTQGWVLTVAAHYVESLLARAPELRGLLARPGLVQCQPSDDMAEIDACFRAIEREMNGNVIGRTLAAEGHLLTLLVALMRLRGTYQPIHAEPQGQRKQIVNAFTDLVEQHYRSQPDIENLAQQMGLTTAQLRSACKEVTGKPPLEIVHERILAEAKRCLTYTPMTVTQIAYWLGFEDGAYFTRFFSRKAGRSPSEFRKAQAL